METSVAEMMMQRKKINEAVVLCHLFSLDFYSGKLITHFFFLVDEYINIAKEKHGYNTEQVRK